MTKILTFTIFLIFSLFAYAENNKLTIGCTTKCGLLYKFAMKRTAWQHQNSIRIIDLSKEKKIDLDALDGILIPGGADIDPKYYFPFVEEDLVAYTESLDYLINYSKEGKKRDPLEYGLLQDYFKSASSKNLPILGICRGMQMLAVSQGIPLYVDIKKELGIRNRRFIYDRIELADEKESIMSELFSHSFRAFKQHHQGIRVNYFQKNRDRWPQLKVTAYSNNERIAESIEFKERPILGVQFHPENDFGKERHDIFKWFLGKAQERFDSR